MLSRNGVGEQQTVPLLRAPNELDIQDLHQWLGVDITRFYGGDSVGRQIHRHGSSHGRRGREESPNPKYGENERQRDDIGGGMDEQEITDPTVEP